MVMHAAAHLGHFITLVGEELALTGLQTNLLQREQVRGRAQSVLEKVCGGPEGRAGTHQWALSHKILIIEDPAFTCYCQGSPEI